MKRVLLAAFVAATAVSGFSQGAIDVGNNFGATTFRAAIFGVDPADHTRSQTGQSSTAPSFPLGGTVYAGARLTTGYSFGFYASTTGITASEDALSLIGTLNFGTGNSAGFVTTTTMNIQGVTAGNSTTYQIRVWDNLGGTITSWAQAVAYQGPAELAMGKSALVNSAALGGTSPGGPVLNAATTGWQSFNVYVVPEPGTIALAGLGVAALVAFRRRK